MDHYSGNVNAGTATVTIAGKGNYSGTASGMFTIGKAVLTVDGTGIAKGTYGDTLSVLTVEGLTDRLNGAIVNGSWTLTGETVPNVGDSGEYTAIFTPPSGAGNYKAPVRLDISKADYTGTKNVSMSGRCGRTRTYELADLLPDGYVLGTVTITDSHRTACWRHRRCDLFRGHRRNGGCEQHLDSHPSQQRRNLYLYG